MDLRKFEDRGYISYRDFLLEVEREVNRLVKRFPALLDSLKRIKGVQIAGNGVTFNWGVKDRLNFSDLLESLNDWGDDEVVVVLDEAQELINLRGVNLLYPFAYSFDKMNDKPSLFKAG
ncbi:hypothetical protein [Metallosphaera hakonensis]|uniref:hypothetical protein n=1 Tax=Metallosphaera hakonensis TaxID=79601 RepID=UPI001F0E49E3|nr:hypothetical protein [Metallosphaera hakonensis]